MGDPHLRLPKMGRQRVGRQLRSLFEARAPLGATLRVPYRPLLRSFSFSLGRTMAIW